jgi:predicted RNase H-like HicB family nuclease
VCNFFGIVVKGRVIAGWVVFGFGLVSQGKTVEDTLGNLWEAIELYLGEEDAKIPTDRSVILPL